MWHDGANGGDGYYGGAREKRTIDKRTYYDWPHTWELVRKLQPEAVIFSDVGPDIRWVGNERGIAGDPCWATYDPVGMDGGPASPGDVRDKESPTGTRHGSHWLPAECDVSIRPGWFWHERENTRVKTPAQLIDLYYESVGRGANLLLNVPPNRDGLLQSGGRGIAQRPGRLPARDLRKGPGRRAQRPRTSPKRSRTTCAVPRPSRSSGCARISATASASIPSRSIAGMVATGRRSPRLRAWGRAA